MEPANDPPPDSQPRADGALAVVLMVVWIVLCVLSIALAVRGGMLVVEAANLRAEVYPDDWPTTGPFSADEVSYAQGVVREQLALLEGRVVVPTTQQVETFAHERRMAEDSRRENFKENRPDRMAAAGVLQQLGWSLIMLGAGLAVIFAWAARVTRARGRA